MVALAGLSALKCSPRSVEGSPSFAKADKNHKHRTKGSFGPYTLPIPSPLSQVFPSPNPRKPIMPALVILAGRGRLTSNAKSGQGPLKVDLFLYLLKAYSPVNRIRTGSPQGFNWFKSLRRRDATAYMTG